MYTELLKYIGPQHVHRGWKRNLILKINWWKDVMSFSFFRRLSGLNIIVNFTPEMQKNLWIFMRLVFISIERIFQIQELGKIQPFS